MNFLIAALGASIYMSADGLSKCPDTLPKGTVIGSPAFEAWAFKLPKHACLENNGNGAYIVTIYGVQRATEQ
jgi:hypothetical protein